MLTSIIIPTLNEEKRLQTCLDSIKNQTHKNIEIIISDSKSTDKTVPIARKNKAKIVHGPKKGPAFGRNLGAKYAKGDILFFVDADSYLPPNLVEKIVSKIQEDKDLVAGTVFVLFYDGNIRMFIMSLLSFSSAWIYSRLGFGVTCGPTAFIRTSIFRKINGFDPSVKMCEDIDLGVRAMNYGKVRILREVVYTSSRRFKKWNLSKTFLTYFFGSLEALHKNLFGWRRRYILNLHRLFEKIRIFFHLKTEPFRPICDIESIKC